jgi:copper chaperone
MSKTVLNVPDISCGHCEATITKALSGQPGVSSVRVDIPAKQVHLDYDESQLGLDQVKSILEEEDYPVESAQ